MFSDDDLKDMISRLDPKAMRPLVGLPLEKWRGLVARLKAGEDYVKYLESIGGPEYVGPEDSIRTAQLNDAWLRSAGKEK